SGEEPLGADGHRPQAAGGRPAWHVGAAARGPDDGPAPAELGAGRIPGRVGRPAPRGGVGCCEGARMTRPVRPGCVYVVGAGPGDPDLLTVRAATVLAAADVVFHDRLVSEEVMARVPDQAVRVDVGHRAGDGRPDLVEVAGPM